MNNLRGTIIDWLWLTLPCVILLLVSIGIYLVMLPLGNAVLAEGKRLYSHCNKKWNATDYSQRELRIRQEIALLDRVIRQIAATRNLQEGTLVEELYTYADSSGFRTDKVEVGVTHPVDDYNETPVSIIGEGRYQAIGLFVQRIENCRQSTRINHLTIKKLDGKKLEAFLDVAVREKIAENANDHDGNSKIPNKVIP